MGFSEGVDERTREILFSPETSGGLLAAIPAARAAACLAALQAAGVKAAIIGKADPAIDPGTIRVE